MSAQSVCFGHEPARTLTARLTICSESMRPLLRPAGALWWPLLWPLLAALPAAAQQPDPIWACVDDQGHKTFSNVVTGHDCHRIDGVVSTIPGTSAPALRPVPVPSAAARGVSPANFPRVDRDTQRMRDVDRRRILEEELRIEQERLTRLREDFNNGSPHPAPGEIIGSVGYRDRTQRLLDDIQRSEGSIASLKRELAPQRY
jgi:hypothetical protein